VLSVSCCFTPAEIGAGGRAPAQASARQIHRRGVSHLLVGRTVRDRGQRGRQGRVQIRLVGRIEVVGHRGTAGQRDWSQAEIAALYGLPETPEELEALRKLIALTQAPAE